MDEYNEKVAEVLRHKNRVQSKPKKELKPNIKVILIDQQEPMENMIKYQQDHQQTLNRYLLKKRKLRYMKT